MAATQVAPPTEKPSPSAREVRVSDVDEGFLGSMNKVVLYWVRR